MATLILLFVLAMLVNEMARSGQDPLHALRPEETPPNPSQSALRAPGPLGTREIKLYFSAQDSRMLAAQPAVIEFSQRTVENCRKAILALISGPRLDHLATVLPDKTSLRALYLLENGELVVDFSSEMLLSVQRPQSTEMETLMLAGVINTLTQAELRGEDGEQVYTVRFLIDGVVPQDGFPAHVDVSAPLVQDRRWIQAGME